MTAGDLPSSSPAQPAPPGVMPPDEALAVLRYGARDEVEARAVEVLTAELVALRGGRQAVLEQTADWETRSGCRLDAWATIRAVRLALGAW